MLQSNLPRARRARIFHSKQGAFDTLEKDFVVQGSSCGSTEWDSKIHELWILCRPLKSLSSSHGPADDGSQVRDAEMLG